MFDTISMLIVEDHESYRKALVRSLKLSNILTIQEATDGKEALEVLEKEKIDILVTDLCMPNMDGHQLLEHLNKKGELQKFALVVINSAETSVGHSAKLLSETKNLYWTQKEFNLGWLTRYLKECLYK